MALHLEAMENGANEEVTLAPYVGNHTSDIHYYTYREQLKSLRAAPGVRAVVHVDVEL